MGQQQPPIQFEEFATQRNKHNYVADALIAHWSKAQDTPAENPHPENHSEGENA